MAVADQPALTSQIIADRTAEATATPWSLTTRVAFRFCFLYFSLYVILTQMLTSLLFVTTNDSGAFELDVTPPAKAIVSWLATHVFRIAHPIVTFETGSGDRIYDWIVLASILALAIAGTILWCAFSRNRQGYPKLYSWFRLFIRFSLAASILTYGAAKILPLQMPFPFLTRLLEPYGHFSPMGVLWSSIGASPAYEIFAGSAEMLAGVLLIFPRTATLGALLCLADATEVFLLNMTYDVPVKLLAFHLILISIFLLAYDARRFASFFVLGRNSSPCVEPALFQSPRKNRIALVVQILFGLWLITGNLRGSVSEYYGPYGPARPKSPLYGIWNMQDFTIDGQVRPPLLTDSTRWRCIVFDFPQYASIEGMDDDSFHRYNIKIDTKSKSFTLTKSQPENWKADFSYSEPTPSELILDGSMDGHKIHAQLELFDTRKFLLVSRGFHWIQDYPFNR